VSGLTVQEIGHRLKPPRSEDWVASRVAETRRTLAANVLEVAGDELPAELRTEAHRPDQWCERSFGTRQQRLAIQVLTGKRI
jgi:hypothetical protein